MEQQKSFRVHTKLLASMCHAMPFSARALKKNIFFDVDIVVKKQMEMWCFELVLDHNSLENLRIYFCTPSLLKHIEPN